MKTIEMKKQDLLNYFGSVRTASDRLLVTYAAVAKWPNEVPAQSAWPAWYISGGKIKHKINIDEDKDNE